MSATRRRRSLADEVYDQLRRMIVMLELRPGEILVEKELCERFSVSRTPLREAVLRLAENGLVTVAPQHGTFVAGIDARAVRQAHFLRSNLEIPVIRQLCAVPAIDLAEPRGLLVRQRLAENDFISFMPLDDRFHQSLFALAGMGELWGLIHSRKAHLDRVRFLQGPQDGKVPTLIEEHQGILDAVARSDAQGAETVLRKHIAGAVLYMEELLLLRPDLFAATE
ncbi:GntR family transcriptional regulator [Mesorhizobium microcysteis]|uniref:GntR family transcriptional regulator n=1 Tax=Neoaquamicrobium microcysteis TaxID=2682781 RepID=A0A5D4GWP5_9HYPH|nr:GntR family transcriptional regulator [Mesorhizobium microcysteis]TYR32717.1 GntR family transcriptional regulator [Mesorhizobium microcysteis]